MTKFIAYLTIHTNVLNFLLEAVKELNCWISFIVFSQLKKHPSNVMTFDVSLTTKRF